MDELTLPAPMMEQWTEWELSQFVIRISCMLYVLPCPQFLIVDTSLADAANQVFMNYPNITAPRSLYALIRRNMSFAETATVQLLQGMNTVHLVVIRHWKSWPKRRCGFDARGPVSAPQYFIVAFLRLIHGPPGCRIMVDKYEGCDNISCRCGM